MRVIVGILVLIAFIWWLGDPVDDLVREHLETFPRGR